MVSGFYPSLPNLYINKKYNKETIKSPELVVPRLHITTSDMLENFPSLFFQPFLKYSVRLQSNFIIIRSHHIWAHGRAFWRSGARLDTRAGILAPGRAFGHVGGHFGAQARVWTRRAGILPPGHVGR